MANKPKGPDFHKIGTYALVFLLALSAFFGMAYATYMAMPASAWRALDLEGRYIWLPDIIGEFFNGKIIGLHFKMANSEVLDVCGAVYPKEASLPPLRPAGIFSLSWGVCGTCDYDVSMSDGNAFALATSRTPITTFTSLMEKGEIAVQPNGAGNRMRFDYARVNFNTMDGQEVPKSIRDYFERYGGN